LRVQLIAFDVDLFEQSSCRLPAARGSLQQLVNLQACQHLRDPRKPLLPEALKDRALSLRHRQVTVVEPSLFVVERQVGEPEVKPSGALTTLDSVKVGEGVKPRRPGWLWALVRGRIERT
jgi:hypothetical protein